MVTLCLWGSLIRLFAPDLIASLYRPINHILKSPGLRVKGVTSFLKPGEVEVGVALIWWTARKETHHTSSY